MPLQYFPKITDISLYSQYYPDDVADEFNNPSH